MSFGTLALVIALGLVGPAVASLSKKGPPLVVGEILAGVVAGKSGFGWINPAQPTLAFLAELGFGLLMVIVGTHIPVRSPALRGSLAKALLPVSVTIVLAVGGGYLLAGFVGLGHPLLLAVLLATSSAAVALPVLQRHFDDAPAVLVGAAWIAMLDVATVLAVPLVLRSGSVGKLLLGDLVIVAGVVLVRLLAHLSAKSGRVKALRKRSKRDRWALDLRVSLLVLCLLCWVATESGTSVLLAGFAVGVMLATMGEPRRLAWQLLGVGEGFLVPLFFVVLGARLDVRHLLQRREDVLLAVVVVIGALVVHVIAGQVSGLPLSLGLLATAQVGVPAAVVNIGLATGVLGAGQGAAIMAGVLASLAIGAVGASMLGSRESLGDHTAPEVLKRPT